MFCAVLIGGCRKHDIRTAAVHVPGLKSAGCAQLIIAILGREQAIGPSDIDVRMDTKTVYVRYNSLQRSVKNLEYSIAKAGFDANEIPANKAAKDKLPAGCK